MPVEKIDSPAIRMTDAAVTHIKKYIEKHEKGIAMRLSVKKAGCSGLRYVVAIAESKHDDEQLFEQAGANVVISRQDLLYYAGTEIDYIQEGLNWKLIFNNPNAQNACGCGESFNLK